MDYSCEQHIQAVGGTSKVYDGEDHSLDGADPRTWTKPAPPRKWIVKNWLPCGYPTLLSGDGGVGKSLVAQQLLTSCATGRPWLGLPVQPCRAYGLMCEDDETELQRRQEAINAAYGVSSEDLGDLRLLSRFGEDNFLMTFDTAGVGQLTELFEHLEKTLLRLRPGIVVLDTLADIFGGDEIKRTHARQFVQQVGGRLARKLDAAVVMLAHPSAAGIQSGTGTSGSTSWHNTVRSRMYLTHSKTGTDQDTDGRILTQLPHFGLCSAWKPAENLGWPTS